MALNYPWWTKQRGRSDDDIFAGTQALMGKWKGPPDIPEMPAGWPAFGPTPKAPKFPWWAAQKAAGLTHEEAAAKAATLSTYKPPVAPKTPAPPVVPGTYRNTLNAIGQILRGIPDATAKAWAQAVFNAYRDYTPRTGMRQSEQEAVLQAQLAELFENVPESAQEYAAAMQRLVQPTVRRPEQEWYEMRAPQRTSPTNWTQLGYRENPQWL